MSNEDSFAQRKGVNVRDAFVFLVDWRLPMLRHAPSLSQSDPDSPAASSADTPSLLSLTLRCLADIIKSKILTRTPDLISIIAFGTRGAPTRTTWPGTRLLRPLRPSDAAGIKHLQQLATRLDAGEFTALHDHPNLSDLSIPPDDPDICFGPDTPADFDKALWAARHQFTTITAASQNVLHRKRLFVFTTDPDPTGGAVPVYKLCHTQARDLYDLGATLDVMLLTAPGLGLPSSSADDVEGISPFFAGLVYTEDGDDRGSLALAPVSSLSALITYVRRKHATKRALRKTQLVIGNDYKIGVTLYALVRRAVRPQKVELVAATNTPVFKITTTTCEEVGQILKPTDVRNMYVPDYLRKAVEEGSAVEENDLDEISAKCEDDLAVGDSAEQNGSSISNGNDKLVYGFTKAEVSKAKAIGQYGLYLYGFRKRSFLRKEYTLSPATFVFPDDSKYVGSTKCFSVLLNSMLKRDVVGIVSARLSKTGGKGMRFAALVPQQEECGEDGEQILPAGMHLYYLPYKDDIYKEWRKELRADEKLTAKKLDESDNDVAQNDEDGMKEEDIVDGEGEVHNESEGVGVARRLVRKLKIRDYSEQTFANPDLERFYAGLSSAAGVESEFQPQDDLLDPDVETMEKRGGHLLRELKRVECGADFDGEAVAERFGTKGARKAVEVTERMKVKAAEREQARLAALQECDTSRFEKYYRDGCLDELLRKDLALYCKAYGLSERGNKRNLVIAVEDHISKKLKES